MQNEIITFQFGNFTNDVLENWWNLEVSIILIHLPIDFNHFRNYNYVNYNKEKY